MRMPNPIVTADVPIGSMRPVSSVRPRRPAAVIANAAAAPITTARAVAHAAVSTERQSVPTGSTLTLMPRRTSVSPSVRHAWSE